MTCAPMIAPGIPACTTWVLPSSVRSVCHQVMGTLRTAGGGGDRATGPMNAGAKRARSDVIQPFLLVPFGAVAAEKLGEKRVAWRP